MSNAAGVAAGSQAAVGGTAGVASTPRKRAASTYAISGGRRTVKSYPCTEIELTSLGAIQGISAIFFTLCGGFFGFYLSLGQTIAFAGKDTPKEVTAYWLAFKDAALYGSLLLFLIAVLLFTVSGFLVHKIKRETEHG